VSRADFGSLASDISRALCRAIEEGRFEMVPTLAREYTRLTKEALRSCPALATVHDQELAVKPLRDALRLLGIVRAHQSARFQKLSGDSTCAYKTAPDRQQGQNLHVRA
jgi:hypothetical protein